VIDESHNAEQHARIGEYGSSFVTVDLQELYKWIHRVLSLVHCSRCPFILSQHTHVHMFNGF